MLKLAVFLLALALLPVTVMAQDEALVNSSVIGFPLPDRVPITVENADQVVELARIGSGKVEEITLTTDGTVEFFASSLGIWIHETDSSEHAVLLPVDTPVTSVALSENIIAGGDETGTIHLWDRVTYESLGVLTNHLYAVRGIAFNADGSLFASADQSGVVRVWNIENLQEQTVTSLPGAYLDALLFADDTHMYLRDESQPELISESDDLYNLLWSLDSETITNLVPAYRDMGASPPQLGPTIFNAVVPANPEVVAFSLHNTVNIWGTAGVEGFRRLGSFSLEDGIQQVTDALARHLPALVQDQAFNGDVLVVGGDSSRIALYPVGNIREGMRLYNPEYLFGHTRGIPSVTFSPTDPRLLVSASLDRTLRLWDVTAPPDTPSLTVLEGHQSGVTSVDINAAGDLIASASYDGTIRLWGIPRP